MSRFSKRLPIDGCCVAGPVDLPQAVLLLGNKADLADARAVSRAEAAAVAAARPFCHFAEVSAKTGDGMADALTVLTELMEAAHHPEGAAACRAVVICVLLAGRRSGSGLSRDTAGVVARHLWATRRQACWFRRQKVAEKGRMFRAVMARGSRVHLWIP